MEANSHKTPQARGTAQEGRRSRAQTGLSRHRHRSRATAQRRKARADSLRREDSGDYSEDDDMFTIDISSDEGTEMESNRSDTKECGGS